MLKNASTHPVWNETLEIPITSIKNELKISCFDKDLFYDDCIGTISVLASRLTANPDNEPVVRHTITLNH
jgi:Ca2+-dependent lipid-binding protein